MVSNIKIVTPVFISTSHVNAEENLHSEIHNSVGEVLKLQESSELCPISLPT